MASITGPGMNPGLSSQRAIKAAERDVGAEEAAAHDDKVRPSWSGIFMRRWFHVTTNRRRCWPWVC